MLISPRFSSALLCMGLCVRAWAQDTASIGPDTETQRFALHAQTTWIWQAKPAFGATYSGPNSLSPLEERSYSLTATADLGLRLWEGAQLHLNPEAAQGVPLSRLSGAGGPHFGP
jgi:high affinity Mn2+ porin